MSTETHSTYEADHNRTQPAPKSRRSPLAMAVVALMVALGSLTLAAAHASAQEGIARLGYRWDVSVSNGWSAIFTRRDIYGAISNQYDAVWYHPTFGEIRSDLRIHIDVRDGLIIERRDLTGPQAGRACRGTGYLDFYRQTAYGTMSCDWAPTPLPWSARIWR